MTLKKARAITARNFRRSGFSFAESIKLSKLLVCKYGTCVGNICLPKDEYPAARWVVDSCGRFENGELFHPHGHLVPEA